MSSTEQNLIPFEPRRWMEEDGGFGAALRAARADPRLCGDQPAAWLKLRGRLARGPASAGRTALLAAAGIAAALLLLVVTWDSSRRWRSGEADLKVALVAEPTSRTSKAVVAEIDVPTGETSLPDGTKMNLSADGRARIRDAVGPVTTVSLAAGALELAAKPRVPGRELRVDAAGYRFRALATRFRVALTGQAVQLEVREGRVSVYQGDHNLASISQGQSWHASTRPKLAPDRITAHPVTDTLTATPSPAEPEPSDTPRTSNVADCLVLARGNQVDQAVLCYEKAVQGTGLSAEMARMELGRLRRDVQHDQAGALEAFEAYAARYPRGTFITEAGISVLELLVRTGKSDQALAESERMLQSGVLRERQSEVYLLRGRILQDKQRDCAAAVEAYGKVAHQPDAVGDQAEFRRAQCLEALGRVEDAQEAYRAYLLRPKPAHAEVAGARLEGLGGRRAPEPRVPF